MKKIRYYFDKSLYEHSIKELGLTDYLDTAVVKALHDTLVTPVEGSKLGRAFIDDTMYTVRLSDCVVD